MGLFRKRQLSERRQRFSHAGAGVIFAIEAFEKLDHHHTRSAIAFALFGLAFLVYATLHPRLHKYTWAPHLEVGVLLTEGAAAAITSATYFMMGKKALPFAYLVPTAMYWVLAYVQHRRNERAEDVHVH